jgi:hypothetical protein
VKSQAQPSTSLAFRIKWLTFTILQECGIRNQAITPALASVSRGIAGRKKEILATMFYPFNAALPCGLASKGLALDLEDPHKYPD